MKYVYSEYYNELKKLHLENDWFFPKLLDVENIENDIFDILYFEYNIITTADEDYYISIIVNIVKQIQSDFKKFKLTSIWK